MSQPPPITCGDRSGFLFAHACDRLATGQCALCAKPICVEHTRMTETGPTCVSCLRDESWRRERDRDSSTEIESPSGSSEAEREAPFTPGGGRFGGAGAGEQRSPEEASRYAKADDPYFHGGGDEPGSYYDADDFAAFGPAAASAGDDASEDGDTIESDTGAS